MTVSTLERRACTAGRLAVRSAGESLTLSGYASLTGVPYEVAGYIETIARGAFRQTLADGADVQLLVNHTGLPLGRTRSGTLRLAEDDRGLRVEADLDAGDPDVQRLVRKLDGADLVRRPDGETDPVGRHRTRRRECRESGRVADDVSERARDAARGGRACGPAGPSHDRQAAALQPPAPGRRPGTMTVMSADEVCLGLAMQSEQEIEATRDRALELADDVNAGYLVRCNAVFAAEVINVHFLGRERGTGAMDLLEQTLTVLRYERSQIAALINKIEGME
jgi:hypothetical protein